MDVERSTCSLLKILSQHLPGGPEKNNEMSPSRKLMSRLRRF
jgi:hypothetical protein